MLLTEWNTEDAIAVAREEGREEGWEKGRETGHEERTEYFLALLDQGLSVEEIRKRLT